jgi:hypothetical protein
MPPATSKRDLVISTKRRTKNQDDITGATSERHGRDELGVQAVRVARRLRRVRQRRIAVCVCVCVCVCRSRAREQKQELERKKATTGNVKTDRRQANTPTTLRTTARQVINNNNNVQRQRRTRD